MISENELIPFERFARIVQYWWVIAIAGILGGLIGLGIHQFRPPVYEAQAVLMGDIDFNKIDFMHPPAPTPAPYHLTQYDEDITIALVDASLEQVAPQVVDYAQKNGIPIDMATLISQRTIERENAYWDVRFRDQNPAVTQSIVNEWAQLAFADLQAKQQAGKLPVYFMFDLVSLAPLPTSPTYFQTNVFVLAGCVIGLVTGLVFVLLPILKIRTKA